MKTLTDFFIGYLESSSTGSTSPEYTSECKGQNYNASEYPQMYVELLKFKNNYPDRFDKSEEIWNQKLQDQGYNYNFFIGSGKIIVPKLQKINVYITSKTIDPSVESDLVTYAITLDDGTEQVIVEPAKTPVEVTFDDSTSETITLKDLETAFFNAEVTEIV